MLRLIQFNSRIPYATGANFLAGVSALRAGIERVLQVIQKHGTGTFRAALDQIISHGERVTRKAIEQIAPGTWSATDHLDNNGIDKAPVKIEVRVSVEGGRIVVDLSGSAPQQRGPVNLPYPGTVSAAPLCLEGAHHAPVAIERRTVIRENITGSAVDELCSRFDELRLPDLLEDPQALAEHVRDTRALIVRNQTRVTSELFRAGSRLIVIGRAGAGLDSIDIESASRAGVVVTYTPGQNSISAAELAIALMLALARKIVEADRDTRAGGWNRYRFLEVELYGKTLGIIGAGKVGYLTGKRAQALGMKIPAWDPFLRPDNICLCEFNAELVGLDELLARADVVSFHVPATPQTIGLLNRQRLTRMEPTAA